MQQYNKKRKNIMEEIRKEFNNEIFNLTIKYQKKYGFKIGTGVHATWNNEADAFKHTFGSAKAVFEFNMFVSYVEFGRHERIQTNNPLGEENMDKWNNFQGRDIAREIKQEYPNWNKFSEDELNDIIAEKVIERMYNGDLITNPLNTKKFNEKLANILEILNITEKQYKNLFNNTSFELNNNISEPITEVNEKIKQNHNKLMPKKHKPMFSQPQKRNTLRDLYNDAQTVLTNTVLFPLYLNNRGLSHEENIKNNFPRMLKAVSKINKIPVNNVMNIIQNKINSHSDKLNNNRQNSFNGINGFNTFNNNNVPINTVNYNLAKYYQPSAVNSVPLEMSNNYVNPIMNNNYPKVNMTNNIPEPVDFLIWQG